MSARKSKPSSSRTWYAASTSRAGSTTTAVSPGAAPSPIVGRGGVGKEGEAALVADVVRGVDEPGGIDDDGRLAARLANLDQSRNGSVVQRHQEATPRTSYASRISISPGTGL